MEQHTIMQRVYWPLCLSVAIVASAWSPHADAYIVGTWQPVPVLVTTHPNYTAAKFSNYPYGYHYYSGRKSVVYYHGASAYHNYNTWRNNTAWRHSSSTTYRNGHVVHRSSTIWRR